MAFILLLCFIVLNHHGFAIDKAQFDTKTVPWSSIGLGVVVAIFSLVGFEAATAFGDEAKNPLKTVPSVDLRQPDHLRHLLCLRHLCGSAG